jgi:hypothetical protein
MKLNAQGSRDMTKMTKTLLAVAAAVFAGTLNAATCGRLGQVPRICLEQAW